MDLSVVVNLISLCNVWKIEDGQTLYQWSCSPLDAANNRYYLPDIPIASGEQVAAAAEDYRPYSESDVYVFPVPSTLNCSGTVSAARYCYVSRNELGVSRPVFTLFLLGHQSSGQGPGLIVTEVIDIHNTPTPETCTDRMFAFSGINYYCCDTMSLTPFQLPSNFTFGIAGGEGLLLGYEGTSLAVEHYRFTSPTPQVGSMYSDHDSSTDRSLRLVQFLIEPDAITTTAAATDGDSTVLGTTTAEGSGDDASAIGGDRNDTSNGDGTASTQGAIIGGVVGCVAVVLIPVNVIIVVVMVMKRRTSWKPDEAATIGAVHYRNSTKLDKGGVEVQWLPFEYEVPEGKRRKQRKPTYQNEEIYMIPGRDEKILSEQLKKLLKDKVTRDTVTLGDKLGSGQFGTVFKGVWLSTIRGDVDVAVKTLKEGSGEEDRVKFLQEAAIMGQFKHPNVVEMYGVVKEEEPVLLVLELLVRGDLQDHLLHMRSDEEGGASVDDHTLLSYCRQVVSGMVYLSSKAFVHRDLAARNVLLSDDDICKVVSYTSQ